MEAENMEQYHRTPVHYRHPSLSNTCVPGSPKSPTYAAQPPSTAAVAAMDVDPRAAQYLEITPTSPTLPPRDYTGSSNSNHTNISNGGSASVVSRPPQPGRDVTPPSPPHSFRLPEVEPQSPQSPGSMHSPGTRPRYSRTGVLEQTPPPSIKQRLTHYIQRRRGVSDASGSTRHRKQGSSSTNATSHHLAYTETTSTRSSVQTDARRSQAAESDAARVGTRSRSNSQSYSHLQMNLPPRLVMNGEEPRVQARQRPRSQQSTAHNRDSNRESQYYEYYTGTGSNSPASERRDYDAGVYQDDLDDYLDEEEDLMSPPLAPVDGMEFGVVKRQPLEEDQSRVGLRGDQTMSGDFEGFRFGLSANATPEPRTPLPPTPSEPTFGGFTSTRPAILRDFSSSDMSGKASSGALVRNESFGASLSSLDRSNSQQAARGAFSRNPSSSQIRSGSAHSSEEVTKDLKRLSKISAGSGVSGLAIIVTTDGAGDLQPPEDGSDSAGTSSRRLTREEKGKARAESGVLPASFDQRSSRKESQQDHLESRRDSSAGSSWTRGETRTEDQDENDSTSLLPSGSEIVQTRKLPAQEPSKDVLVHQGNPAYEFVYRMRHTPSEDPILVPQYRYPSSSAFPNRNALSRPITAKPGSANSNISSISAHSITAPPPALSLPYLSMPQGDNTEDQREDIHPLFRSTDSFDNSFNPGFCAIEIAPDGAHTPIIQPSPRLSLTAPSPMHRRSWSPALRPPKFFRRSLTPHLYSPQDINLAPKEETPSSNRSREKRIGRFLICVCVLFPPLLFVVASGGFDGFVSTWTSGEVRRVGRVEKKTSLVVGTLCMIVVVVAVVVGVSVGVTAG